MTTWFHSCFDALVDSLRGDGAWHRRLAQEATHFTDNPVGLVGLVLMAILAALFGVCAKCRFHNRYQRARADLRAELVLSMRNSNHTTVQQQEPTCVEPRPGLYTTPDGSLRMALTFPHQLIQNVWGQCVVGEGTNRHGRTFFIDNGRLAPNGNAYWMATFSGDDEAYVGDDKRHDTHVLYVGTFSCRQNKTKDTANNDCSFEGTSISETTGWEEPLLLRLQS